MSRGHFVESCNSVTGEQNATLAAGFMHPFSTTISKSKWLLAELAAARSFVGSCSRLSADYQVQYAVVCGIMLQGECCPFLLLSPTSACEQ